MDHARAPKAAVEAAKMYGTTPRRAKDTEQAAGCWIAFESDESAVVVYDDEPDVSVQTGNHKGRFIYSLPLADAPSRGGPSPR